MSEAGLTQTRQAALDPTGANKASFYADRPMKITRWGWITSITALTGQLILTASIEEADSTVADPTGEAQGGTLTVVAATFGAINKGAYIEAEDFATTAPLTMVPGEVFEILSDATPSAGSGHVFMEFEPLPFQDPNRPTADPGAVQRATQLAAMTKLSS